MNVLLVQPLAPKTYWGFQYAVGIVGKGAPHPPLGLATLAALLPDRWNLRILDLNVTRLRDDDLRWADGIAWGTPTRYGNMSAQMKQFVDTTGGLWLKGELEDKATGIFTSTATIHGGQETTILTALVPLIHLGMVFVGTPYGQNPQILVTDGIGGSPYGPGTLAGTDGSRQPVEAELTTARNLGSRLARVAGRLKDLRVSRASAP